MIYPEQFEHKLGFDKIRTLLTNACLSNATHLSVDNMCFMTDKTAIIHSLNLTEELKQVLMFHEDFPMSEFVDLGNVLSRLSDKHFVMQENDFLNLLKLLDNLQKTQKFTRKLSDKKFPLLKQQYDEMEFPQWVKDRIRIVFTTKGEIKTNASKLLQELYDKLTNLENTARKEMNRILQLCIKNGWTSEDTSVSVIDGHRAIPIEAAFKRKIAGYIIGESATGKTSYIVPEEFSQNNIAIQNTERAIFQEKKRILSELTDDIRDYQNVLSDCLNRHIVIDFHRSKAKLAISLEAISPAIGEHFFIKYHKARHPILYLNFKKQNREVVPFTLEFNENQRFLVISGPNAGGKTVSLQTVGLLQYMVQCGLQIPVGGNTETCIIKDIFIDLGDDQSIENDLSTYSSHLQNMKYMLKNAGNKSLILIDEFGGGTDPEMGSAIAEAMLQHLVDKKAFGIITTHYANLKHFASNYPGVENAAMLIDNQNMEPLFQLETGMPGSSYSFEIANRSGIPQEITLLAKSKIGKDQLNFDKHLRQVIRDKRYWEDKRKSILLEEKKLSAEIKRHSVAFESFQRKEKEILNKAKAEAEKMISEVNRKIENTIRIIKESQADKEKTKQARKSLVKSTEHILKTTEQLKRNSPELKNLKNTLGTVPKPEKITASPIKNEIRIGSSVFIKHLNKQGEIIDIGDKNYVVRLGNMITTIPKSQVEISSTKLNDKNNRTNAADSLYYSQIMSFKDQIDLRGKRVDEALQELSLFVDTAVVSRAKEIKILHGKGGGILRQVIRDYLSTIAEVEGFMDEDIRLGGDGITVVKFRI
jgi:DNA mismatch repair protein MutS2